MVIQVREATASDKNFIYATWLRGLYYGCPFYNKIDKRSFFKNYEHVLDNILRKSKVHVACLEEDPDLILGYAVTVGPILHWCFVKESYRKQGIVKKILENKTITHITHLTTVGEHIADLKGYTFDPFLI